jgi:hypothetical protein
MEPLLSLETITPGVCGIDEPPSWHFVNLARSKLYVIPSVPSHNHYEVDVYLTEDKNAPSFLITWVS